MSKDTGRQRRLDPEKIVTSAIEIADAEGLDAVTIRRLAAQHDVTPMSLYRHFRDKDELLDAIAKRLLAEVHLPEPTDEPWHQQIRDVLTALVTALSPHPNIAGLAFGRILHSDPGLNLTDRTLGLLAQGGIPVDRAALIASQTLSSLIALVAPASGTNDDTEARDDALREKRATLAALSPRRYPHIVAAADALAECSSGQGDRELAIDLIVAGMRGIQPTR